MEDWVVYSSASTYADDSGTKKQNDMIKVKIGEDDVTQVTKAKLLGMTFDDNLKWTSQIYGKGVVLSSLNQRLLIIRRLKYSLSKKCII